MDFTRNNYDLKLNYNVSPAAQVFAKYSQMNGTVYSDMWLGNPPDGGAGGYGFGDGSGTGDTKVRIGTLGLTWTLSPKLVVDGTFGMMRFDQTCLPPDYGTNFGTDVFGIPGTNGDGGSNGDIRASGMPGFSISGFEPFGGVDGWTPLFRNDRSYNFNTNATYTASKHELRFGFDVVKMELNHWQPELAYGPRGYFVFYGGTTTLAPSGSPDEYNAYAQFLLGQSSYMTKTIQYELQTGREWQYGVYLRDRWQVTKDLTLNLGLRWEKYPLMTRENRGIEVYDQTNNTVVLGGVGGNPEDLGIEVKHQHFLPRIGFSYRLGENNVVRGGYGVTVSPIPFSRPLRGFYPATITNDTYGDTDYLPAGTLDHRHPALLRPRLELGRPAPARQRRHGLDVPRPSQPRHHPVLEPDLRAPAALGHVGVRGLRGHQDGEAARLPGHQRRGRGTGTGGAAAQRGVRAHGLHLALRRLARRELPLAAGGPQQAVQQGLLPEGGLHLLEGHEPHQRRGLVERRLELPDAAVQELRPRGLRPGPHLPARLPAGTCRSGRTVRASGTRSSRTGR